MFFLEPRDANSNVRINHVIMTATLSAATLTAQWRPQFMNQNEIMIKHYEFELGFFFLLFLRERIYAI